MIKRKNTRKTAVNAKKSIKDHSENDFKDCDRFLTNLCGRKIELDKQQQKEVLEFVYAISNCVKDTGDPLKNAAKYSDVELRGLLLIIMKKSIDSIPPEKLFDAALEILCRMDDDKGKITIH